MRMARWMLMCAQVILCLFDILEVSGVVCQRVGIICDYDFPCSEILLTACVCRTTSSKVIYGGSNSLDPYAFQHPKINTI